MINRRVVEGYFGEGKGKGEEEREEKVRKKPRCSGDEKTRVRLSVRCCELS